MYRTLLTVSSLITLAACTQAAAPIAVRGQDYFGKGSHNFASYQAPEPSQERAAPVTMANAEPTQTVAPISSISVNDLQPASGKPAEKIEEKPAPKAEVKPVPKLEMKTASAEAVPANGWTKKPRDAASFTEAKAAPAPSLTPAPPAHGAQFIWPVSSHNVTTAFGSKSGKATDGISITAPEGEPVWSAADGEVIYADSKMEGYGKMVIIKHNGGKTTTYAHLARYGVEKYDRVKQGDIIGYVGATGKTKKPELYFSMRDGTKAIDPQPYLDRKVAGL